MGVGDDAVRHLVGARGIGEGPGGQELGGDDEAARRQHPLEDAAAADILEAGVECGHVTLLSLRP